jgi:hypothetical protein
MEPLTKGVQMENKNNIDRVLSQSLHDLGLTPQTGFALCALIHENSEDLLRLASRRKECPHIPNECGSCGRRPQECREALRQLPKIYVWRVLKKWVKYCADHKPDCKRTECPVRQFLMPAMKNLLNVLIQNGLTMEYVKAEIPAADKILQFGVKGKLLTVG